MIKFLLVLGCLSLAAIAIASPPPSYAPQETEPTTSPPSYVPPGTGLITPPPEGPDRSNPDWLSSDVSRIIYYGPYGYPAVGFYDDRMLYDEWYPVARSFLDGTTYYRTYYYYTHPYPYSYPHPIYLDGRWWKDPRGYRPLYRIRPGFLLGGAS